MDSASQLFESLSSELRLTIFKRLVRAGKDGVVAGQLATELNLAGPNLSFHLKNLSHANLITVEQEGRFLRYRANIPLMLELVGFLTENCCGDKPSDRAELGCTPTCCPTPLNT